MKKRPNCVLTIAGVDPSGGAGIAADLKTIGAHGCYGMCAVTALTAQNTTGVFGVRGVDASFVAEQVRRIFDDIPPDAVKIGMTGSAAVTRAVAEVLREVGAKRVVCDPVMVATSGGKLLETDAVDALWELFAQAAIITPNISEAEALCGEAVNDHSGMERAATTIRRRIGEGPAILIKGGHLDCEDLLLTEEGPIWLHGRRVETKNSHGTGCTLSSAIACNLCDTPLLESVRRAKRYVEGALGAGLELGAGSGPLDHFYDVTYNSDKS